MNNKTIFADLTEMVFEDRGRAYGAYQLRKLYNQRLTLATVLGLGLFFAGITAPNFIKEEKVEMITARTIELPKQIDFPPIQEEDEKPPIDIPKIEPPAPPRMVASLIPDPTPEDDLEEDNTINDMETLLEAPNIGIDNIDGSDEVFIDIPDEEGTGQATVIEARETEPSINDYVPGQEPQPINMDDVKELVGYPEIALESEIQGMVVVRVLVDKDGKYRKHKVIKKAHPLLAEAVEKQIHKLSFTPAIQAGKPIMFWVNIPFRFNTLN